MARLAAIADELSAHGAEVSWAVPEQELKSTAILPLAALRTAAPQINLAASKPSRRMNSFADILAQLGFIDSTPLLAAVRDWLELFARLAVDRVVLDYAPAAQLAALVAGLPAAQITCGFDAPPPECPVFGIGMRGPMLEAHNASQLRQIDRTLDTVGQQLGLVRNTSINDLLTYPTRWYDCIPEADPYGPRADGCYVGPLGKLECVHDASWPAGPVEASKVFVYLRSEQQLRAMLSALPAERFRVLCVWPGASEKESACLRRSGLTLLSSPVDLNTVLPQSDMVVSYGAAATACRSLLLGIPQLLLPTEIDKHLIASRIVAIGAGILLGPRAELADMRESVEALTTNLEYRNAAQAVSFRYSPGFGGLGEVCKKFLRGDTAVVVHEPPPMPVP